jgi:hypothetical protein
MLIEQTPLQNEIDAILLDGPKPVHNLYKAVIITPKERFQPLRILSIDIERNYLEEFADQMLIELLMPKGAYIYDLLPYRQELQLELTRMPQPEGHEPLEGEDAETEVKQYRAIIQEDSDEAFEAQEQKMLSRMDSNRDPLYKATFQLIAPAVEQLRLMQAGGIYRNDVPGNVVRYVLTHACDQLELPEDEAIAGVDRVEWDNENTHPQIVIPHGTPLEDVADLIQTDWGGVYNTGIGCYIQDQLWYLWPLFNTERFEQEKRVIQIFNLPPNHHPGIERTWRMDEHQLIILSTGEVAHLDLSQPDQLNLGNGARYSHTDPLWAGQTEYSKNVGESTKDNKFKIKRSDHNSEHVLKERKDYNVVPVVRDRQSNNSFAQTSRIASRLGGIVTLTWEYSKPEFIYPGMPARLFYLKEDEIEEIDGVIIKTHHYIHSPKQGLDARHFRCNSALTLYLKAPPEDKEGSHE